MCMLLRKILKSHICVHKRVGYVEKKIHNNGKAITKESKTLIVLVFFIYNKDVTDMSFYPSYLKKNYIIQRLEDKTSEIFDCKNIFL